MNKSEDYARNLWLEKLEPSPQNQRNKKNFHRQLTKI